MGAGPVGFGRSMGVVAAANGGPETGCSGRGCWTRIEGGREASGVKKSGFRAIIASTLLSVGLGVIVSIVADGMRIRGWLGEGKGRSPSGRRGVRESALNADDVFRRGKDAEGLKEEYMC